MDTTVILASLPKLGDGHPAYPGLRVERDYLGERWTAIVVGVTATSIDVQYDSDANHRAKGCVSRGFFPQLWRRRP
jgi:hypothetical protein